MKTVRELSPEQHEARKEQDRAKYAARRAERAAKAKARYAAASPEERAARTARNRAKYAAMTPEQRQARRDADRAKRQLETPDQRQARLDKILIDTRRREGVKNPTAERRVGMCAVRGCEYNGPLHLDHWHDGPKKGEWRGWVCSRCNTAMGLTDDSPARLRALAEYVELAAGVGWPVDTAVEPT